ncbi:MAG TPA: ferredoxin [Candidatus Lustribacter sp.]|nr:ferredoxin [Candidatus Lustribacter sp.]
MTTAVTHRLRVDWPLCTARGLCSELLPEAVALDEWGYPVVTSDIGDDLVADARAAVKACPQRALRLVPRN